jgi:hypothetical protein
MTVAPAAAYEPPADLALVSAFFNPGGFRSKRRNLELFVERVERSGLTRLIVEGAFGQEPFALAPGPGVMQVRCRDVMWQKERLLNLAVARLPPAITKVAWLDCDILFENPRWAVETSRLLDEVAVVQPFATAIRLPPARTDYDGQGVVDSGFACACERSPGAFLSGRFAEHGHTGYAWAARRELVARHGLYDAGVAGSADHLMAHAMCGDWSSPCVPLMIGRANPYADHFRDWAERIYRDVGARLGHVAGAVLHLWHGDVAHRRYTERNLELLAFGFDPRRDLGLGADGAWEWNSDKPALHRWCADYFVRRREDEGADSSRF